MSENSFEKKLREKVDDFEPRPREFMWEDIAASLEPEKKKKKLLIPFLSYVLLAGIAVVSYTYFKSANNKTELHLKPIVAKEPAILSPESDYPSVNKTIEIIPDKKTKNLSVNRSSAKYKSGNAEDEDGKKMQNVTEPQKDDIETIYNPNTIEDFEKELLSGVEENKNVVTEKGILSDNISLSTDSSKITDIELPSKTAAPVSNPDTSSNDQIARPKQKTGRFYTGIQFSPGMIKTRISLDQQYSETEPYKSQYSVRNNGDKGLYSYSFGINAGYISGKMRYGLGLEYLRLEYQMPVRNINEAVLRGVISSFTNFDYNATDSFILARPAEGGTLVKNRYSFLSIPFSLSGDLWNKKHFSLRLNTGLTANFLVAHSGLLLENESGLYVKSAIANESHVRKFHFSAGIGPEFSYNISRRFSVLLNPQIQYALQPLEGARLKTSYMRWSIGSGIRYTLY